jgi:adenine-specific DNA glycosylase
MATADCPNLMLRPGRQAVATTAASKASETTQRASESKASETTQRASVLQRESQRDAWQKLIDFPLIEWGQNPQGLNDDDLTAPSQERIVQAIELATLLRDSDWAAPKRIVPDGHGGIVFEYRSHDDSAALRIAEAGSIEFVAFKGPSLILRRQL